MDVVATTIVFQPIHKAHDTYCRSPDHLEYLKKCNKYGGDDSGPLVDRLEKIVGIHEGMDCIIHGHEIETKGRLVYVTIPREEEDGNMMVRVEEYHFPFAQDKKDDIHEFKNF